MTADSSHSGEGDAQTVPDALSAERAAFFAAFHVATGGDAPTRTDDPSRRDESNSRAGRRGKHSATTSVLAAAKGVSGSATVSDEVPSDGPAEGAPTEATGAEDRYDFPPALERRFRVIDELDRDGHGQGTVLLCETRADRSQVVVKIFNSVALQAAVDPRLAWSDLDPRHVVQFMEPKLGTYRGKWWEVLEYCKDGTLRDLARLHGGALPMDLLLESIRQVNDALDYLHGRPPLHLVHRDIKPANILVRRAAPLDVVLTDFGTAVALANTLEFHPGPRTLRYTAPESLGTKASPVSVDWWSFGISIAELATGRHPYEEVLQDDWRRMFYEIDVKPVPLDYVADERLRHLLKGLLTRNPAKRWKAKEVRRWLAGESPEIADASDSRGRVLLPFHSNALVGSFIKPQDIAAAIASDWNAGGRLVSGRELEELGAWLVRSFGIEIDDVSAGRTSSASPYRRVDRAITELIVRLDPNFEPTFRDEKIAPTQLEVLAKRAAHMPQSSAEQVTEALYVSRALQSFRAHETFAPLADVDDRWQRGVDEAAGWFERVPAAGAMTPSIRASILASVVSADPRSHS